MEIIVLGGGGPDESPTCSHRSTKLHVSKYLSGPMHYGEDSRSVIRLRFVYFGLCTFTSIRSAQVQLYWYPTVFLHSPRHSWGIYRTEGQALQFPADRTPVSCDISHRVTTVSTSQSSLDLWPPRLCFSAGNRLYLFGDELLWYNHNQRRFFSDEITRHVNLMWFWPCIVDNMWK
jgi:hypothetical protein